MGVDYYNVLSVPRSAQDTVIRGAYRRLALKHHPERAGDSDGNVEQFRMIAEAYTVLSDPVKRSKFDKFGEEGLKQGILDEGENRGWQYVADPLDLFHTFFGEHSPLAIMVDEHARELQPATRGLTKDVNALSSLELELRCTLEEIFTGATKAVKVQRQRYTAGAGANDAGFVDETTLNVKLDPSWKAGMKLRFAGEGNQLHPTASSGAGMAAQADPFCPPGDVIFTIVEEVHAQFERIGDSADLLYVHKCSLADALCGQIAGEIRLLDGSVMNLSVPEVVEPGYEKRVVEHGFAKGAVGSASDAGKYGDLVVRFDIQFPTKPFSVEQKKALRALLGDEK